jgi:hypothetical protein
MNKYEQLIEHIINDEEDKARALFHQIVVEKSRDIYESLMDEEYAEEGMGGGAVDTMIDEITRDETDGIRVEGDDDPMNMDDMDMGDMDDEEGDEEGDLEQKVMDLESELEALKAEFEQLMGDEEGDMDGMDMDDMDMDDEEGEEDESDDFKMYEAQHDDEDKEKDKEDKEDEEKMDESVYESRQRRPLQKTAVDLMREYVEKISTPSNTEGQPAGTSTGGDHANVNTQSTVAGKNDMGGTAKNLVQGGDEQAPDGTSPKGKADGHLVKNVQEIDVAKRNVNKPGGNKGAQNWYSTKASAKKGEGQTTDGSVPVQKKSIEPGGN